MLWVRRYDLAQDRYETDALHGGVASLGTTDQKYAWESAEDPGIDAVGR
jgi:hypothetical protein